MAYLGHSSLVEAKPRRRAPSFWSPSHRLCRNVGASSSLLQRGLLRSPLLGCIRVVINTPIFSRINVQGRSFRLTPIPSNALACLIG